MSDAMKQIADMLQRLGSNFVELQQIESATTHRQLTKDEVQRVTQLNDAMKQDAVQCGLTAAASIVQDFNRIADALETIAKELKDEDTLLPSTE